MFRRTGSKLLGDPSRRQRAHLGRARSHRRLLLEPLEERLVLSTLLATDQTDYTPGSIVTFQGSGFAPNETIDLVIDSTTSDEVALTLTDDADGNFTIDWNVGYNNVGATLTATATGEDAGDSATVIFTDGNAKNVCQQDGTHESTNFQFPTRQDVYITVAFTGSTPTLSTGTYFVRVIGGPGTPNAGSILGMSSTADLTVDAMGHYSTTEPQPSGTPAGVVEVWSLVKTLGSGYTTTGFDSSGAGTGVYKVEYAKTIADFDSTSTYDEDEFKVLPESSTGPTATSITTMASAGGVEGSVILNDTATLTSTDQSLAIAGSLTFTLYGPDSTSTVAYTETDPVSASGPWSAISVTTTNTVATPQEGLYQWAVTFTSTNTNYTGSSSATGSEPVTVTGAPPSISSADVHFCEGDTATNTGSYSDYDSTVTISPSEGTITGDGAISGTWSWTESGLSVGTHTITLTATNDDSLSAVTSFTVTVGNETPTVASVVVAGGGGVEGSNSVSVSGTWTDPGNDATSGTVDWGDGSLPESITVNGDGTYSSGSHTYLDEGMYPITVSISDGGSQDPDCPAGSNGTGSVDIVDAPPTISAPDVHLCEADPGSNTATASDYDDGVTVTQTSGPGMTTTGGVWSTTGLPVGTYTVGLLATNGDSNTAATSFTVTVGNVAPTVSTVVVSPSGSITVGLTPVSVSGLFSDPGMGSEIYAGTVDWGDSSSDPLTISGGSYSSPTHTYTSVATFTVLVTITDGNGASDSMCPPGAGGTTTVTTIKASPTISTATSPSSTTLGTGVATLNDSATLMGGFNETGTITFKLYGPGGGLVYSEMVSASGNTTVGTSVGYVPAVAGVYQWVACFAGDDNNQPIASTKGDEPVNVYMTITGVKFDDANTNQTKDSGESVLSGWTIYLDTNNNGMLDTGETFTGTDTNGSYSFVGLLPGTYHVREVLQTSWNQTTGNLDVTPSTNTNVVDNFGNVHIVSSGTVKTLGFWGNSNGQSRLNTNDSTTIAAAEVQKVTATGAFTLTFNGRTTGTLPFGASTTAVASALNGLTSIGGVGGAVSVSLLAPNCYKVTFGGGFDGANVAQMTATGATVSTTTNGSFTSSNWRVVLNSLNLRNASGAFFNVDVTSAFSTAYSAFNTWLQGANATNMAYMLSAQLATMQLNVLVLGQNPLTMLNVGSTSALKTWSYNGQGASLCSNLTSGATTFSLVAPNGLGYISIQDLMNNAKAMLATYNSTVSSSAARTYEEALKIVLDGANNGLPIFAV